MITNFSFRLIPNDSFSSTDKIPSNISGTQIQVLDERKDKKYIHYTEITAAFAYWAVKQVGCANGIDIPIAHAPKLEILIQYLKYQLIKDNIFNDFGYAEISIDDISKILKDKLFSNDDFLEWNTSKALGNYWLDLDAIIMNICATLRHDTV